MDAMHDDEDVTLNVKAIGLAIGGAALAALLFALVRRDDKPEPAEAVMAAVDEAKDDAKKAAKAAKKRQKSLAKAIARRGEDLAHEAERVAASVHFDKDTAERDLKAAAWDAQQEARAAESRLRATGGRVVDDAAHLASRVGHEARSLADGGRERISHLRHRAEDASSEGGELESLRAEVEHLRRQLGSSGRKSQRDYSALVSKISKKSGGIPEEAVSAGLAHLERSLKAKGPALLAARDKKQALEILQSDLGPVLRESMIQALAAALGMAETTRERPSEAASSTVERSKDALKEVFAAGREAAARAEAEAAEVARQTADDAQRAVKANGKDRFWSRHGREHDDESAPRMTIEPETVTVEVVPQHRSKAGLFWGGAGLGLALYALLDAERREHVLRVANEASVQVQELVRDLQGYDDEFS